MFMETKKFLTKVNRDLIDRWIGITTTVPVEIIFAAGLRPVDLNNIFIVSGHAKKMIQFAERAGFPENSCSWNKGVYAAARDLGLKRVVGVVQGDCSNTHATTEMLRADGVEIIPFAYPYNRDERLLRAQLQEFAEYFGVSGREALDWKRRLDKIRGITHRLDELAWREGKVRGEELHLWQVSSSDFLGDPDYFECEASDAVAEAEKRKPVKPRIRLALLGIPPICDGLFDLLSSHGADVVFDEVPRQFSMPYLTRTLAEQYRAYTYPYDVFARIEDIREQVSMRRIDGAIHYVQSFCFRQVQDTLIRRALDIPILTLECDKPGPLDGRSYTRVEAFLEMMGQGR